MSCINATQGDNYEAQTTAIKSRSKSGVVDVDIESSIVTHERRHYKNGEESKGGDSESNFTSTPDLFKPTAVTVAPDNASESKRINNCSNQKNDFNKSNEDESMILHSMLIHILTDCSENCSESIRTTAVDDVCFDPNATRRNGMIENVTKSKRLVETNTVRSKTKNQDEHSACCESKNGYTAVHYSPDTISSDNENMELTKQTILQLVTSNYVKTNVGTTNEPAQAAISSKQEPRREKNSAGPIRSLFHRVIRSIVNTGLLQQDESISQNVPSRTRIQDQDNTEVHGALDLTESKSKNEITTSRKRRNDEEFDILDLENDSSFDGSNHGDDDDSNKASLGDQSTTIDDSMYELAVAELVIENLESYGLPSAIEYDIDKKNSTPDRQQKQHVVATLLLLVFVSLVVGCTIGILGHRRKQNTGQMNRSKLGIRELIVKSIPNVESILTNDPLHPYSQALEWILYNDPLELDPRIYPTFLQRYILATLYFSTARSGPWKRCSPPTLGNMTVPSTDTSQPCHSSNPYGVDYFSSAGETLWLSNTTECLWSGIRCDQKDHIRRISLVDMGIEGTIPETLGHLSFVSEVEFSFAGKITGTIPDVNLNHLIEFGARDTLLTGHIPKSMVQGRLLQYLRLGGNQFNNLIFNDITKNMKVLDVSDNLLTNSTLYVTNLQSLFALNIGTNQFMGTIPNEVFDLPYLGMLYLNDNAFMGSIPEIPWATSLMLLDISNNQLTGNIPRNLYNQTSLTDVILNNNYFDGTIATEIGNLLLLGTLLLDHNNLVGTVPTELGKLTSLLKVTVSQNMVSGQIPDDVCNLRGLALQAIQADCLEYTAHNGTSIVEIECPTGCCTRCCSSEIDSCVNLKRRNVQY